MRKGIEVRGSTSSGALRAQARKEKDGRCVFARTFVQSHHYKGMQREDVRT